MNQSEIVYHDIGRHVYTKHGSRHNWRSDDLLKLARREKRKIIVSAETGLDDLTEAKYPWFNETCESNPLSSVHYCLLSVDDQPSDVKSSDAGFFSVVRNPYEWVLSAENHMRQTHHGGFYSNYGYFDLGNIQSRMTGYGSSGISAATVCVGTIDHFSNFESGLVGGIVPLTVENEKPHSHNYTAELRTYIQERYNEDLELSAFVHRQQKLVCW